MVHYHFLPMHNDFPVVQGSSGPVQDHFYEVQCDCQAVQNDPVQDIDDPVLRFKALILVRVKPG